LGFRPCPGPLELLEEDLEEDLDDGLDLLLFPDEFFRPVRLGRRASSNPGKVMISIDAPMDFSMALIISPSSSVMKVNAFPSRSERPVLPIR
jgi:hypothetical protein